MMRRTTPIRSLPRLAVLVLGVGCLSNTGCASTPLDGIRGENTSVRGKTRPFSSKDDAGLRDEIQALLSSDTRRSQQAERNLRGLNEDERTRLLQIARERPAERDPRWLSLMEDLHGPVLLSPDEEWRYLSWRVAQPDRVRAMRAQSRLADLAHTHPEPLLRAALQREPGYEAAVLALASARHPHAAQEFVRRYRSPLTHDERRLMAEALAVWTGDRLIPRTVGEPWEIEADASRITTMVASLTPHPTPSMPGNASLPATSLPPISPFPPIQPNANANGGAGDPWAGTLVPAPPRGTSDVEFPTKGPEPGPTTGNEGGGHDR